jgi:hypothetical protein
LNVEDIKLSVKKMLTNIPIQDFKKMFWTMAESLGTL